MHRPGPPDTPPGRDARSAPGSALPPAPDLRIAPPRPVATLSSGDPPVPPGPRAPAPHSPPAPTPRGYLSPTLATSSCGSFSPPPSPGPLRCSAGTTAPGCARVRPVRARRPSGARADFPRPAHPGGSRACKASAPLRGLSSNGTGMYSKGSRPGAATPPQVQRSGPVARAVPRL